MILPRFVIIAGPGVMAALFALAGSQAPIAAQDTPTILRKSDTQLRATATYKVEADQTMARQAKISGIVGVRLVIGVDGRVETATAVSGPQLLRDWALSAARAWQWQPAVVGGVAVKVSGTLFFRFTADPFDDSNKDGGEKKKQQGNEDRGADGTQPSAESALDHFNQGLAFEKDEKYQEAILAFQDAIKLNPDFREAYLEIATIYGRLKRYDDQIQACTKALERFPGPGSDQFLAQLAAALGMMGKYEEAIAVENHVIHLRPDDADAYISLASFQYYGGHYKEAAAAATESARIKPVNPMAYHDLGAACVKLGRLDDAIAAYKHALEFQPQYEGSAEVLIELANVYTSMKQTGEALGAAARAEQYLEEPRQREPAPTTLFERLGDAFDRLNKKDKALSAWRRALSLTTEPERTARIKSKINSAAPR